MKTIIPITESERIKVQKENPKNTLIIASRRKNSGGSTYWIQTPDKTSLSIVAECRGIPVGKLLRQDGSDNHREKRTNTNMKYNPESYSNLSRKRKQKRNQDDNYDLDYSY